MIFFLFNKRVVRLFSVYYWSKFSTFLAFLWNSLCDFMKKRRPFLWRHIKRNHVLQIITKKGKCMSPITKCRAIRYLFTVLIPNEYRYDELILYFDKLKKLPFDFDFVKLIYIVFLIVNYRNFETIIYLLSSSIAVFIMIHYKYLHN